ncbi:ArsR/SmtB family transcription factor [Brevibacterium linens]|uniref:Metalloregulator ArsR/SmtB family transcription factor n=1 Tax=Brevibacterium epidermidis TaxID=1698 RepID=A0A9D2ZVY6_BREEP|nr:metalloregulator ArsR/SmtB family transcription factor [Brevibacterium epidermidis]
MTTQPALAPTEAGVCCPSLTVSPLSLDDAQDFARILKSVADPTRLRLVSLIAAHEQQEACVCDLTDPVGLGQPTVSHHLKILVDAGVLRREKRGVWSYYSLEAAVLNRLSEFLAPN